MTIETQIGDNIIKIGVPSINHAIFSNDNGEVLISFAEWEEIKTKVDKMFKAAQELK